jgi:hypothetical protein
MSIVEQIRPLRQTQRESGRIRQRGFQDPGDPGVAYPLDNDRVRIF